MLGRPILTLAALLFTALPILAQSDPVPIAKPKDSESSAASVPGGNPTQTKRVWTNENLNEARGSVSVVGGKNSQKYPLAPGKPADAVTAAGMKQNLEKLQAKLAEVKKQLAVYKEFEDGEPVSTDAREWNKGITRTPVNQQMVALKEKAKQLQKQIDDLLDEARKRGVLPGQLR